MSNKEMTDAIRKAYGNLSDEEAENIKRICIGLIDKMKAKYGRHRVIFGFDSALELVACLGIAINDNRIRFVK